MKSVIVQFIIAAVLFAAGAATWSEARTARRVADAYQRFATLRYDVDDRIGETASMLDRVPLPLETLGSDVRRHRATVAYWRSEYGSLTSPLETLDQQAVAADPRLMMVRANASYRTSLTRLDDTAILERLDGVINAYADVLRADPGRADASFNYEYVVRFRDRLAKLRPRDRTPKNLFKADDPVIESVDLPTGPTMYGRPGGPPPEIPGNQFKTIAPMPYDERVETDPGRGATPRRRG
ncbi:MAG: hypothetical protein AB7N65_06825, partial [Vicinamibacterales bacterium]